MNQSRSNKYAVLKWLKQSMRAARPLCDPEFSIRCEDGVDAALRVGATFWLEYKEAPWQLSWTSNRSNQDGSQPSSYWRLGF